MEENPYSALIGRIRNDMKALLPVTFRMGKVISAEPLKVDVAGTIQEADSLLINAAFSFFAPLEPEEPYLTIGDMVLLVPIEDEQMYIILCKVVSV